MGSITTGVGLVSGIDIASLIDSIISLESAGKTRLQSQLGRLQTQRTALLDINARLLNLKNTSRTFRFDNVFSSTFASSSNEDVLTATSTSFAQPGSFQFIVKQLVSTSQHLSRGYATADATPLGLDSLSFEFGAGTLAQDRSLDDLNGGAGAARGKIRIQDRTGATATIDLTDATTVNEVLAQINDAEGVSVTASVEDDHLVITDTSGSADFNLTVSNASGYTTATELGIAGTIAGNQLTGTGIYGIGLNTALSSLNDGNGVLIRNAVTDFTITASDGRVYEIDLGRVDVDIDDSTSLEDLNNGAGITFDDDTDEPDITFVARDGTEYQVDLTGVTTVGGLRSRISAETGGHIELSVTGGDRFTVTDTIGGAGNLKIEGAGLTGTDAAEDLGILNEAGVAQNSFTGTAVPNAISLAAATTVGDVIDRINNAVDTIGAPNAGQIVASIAPDGRRIQITDNGPIVTPLTISSTAGNPDAAADLGIATAGSGPLLTGGRIIGDLGSVLAGSLNGGSGLGGATAITISDRNNVSFSLATLDVYDTLSEIITAINDEAAGQGVQISVDVNDTGTGLRVTDTSGGSNNLTISGDAATALGIAADVAADELQGSSAQLQYVSNATRLDDLNYGRGIGVGSFRITDGLGDSATVSIGGTEETLYDVIAEINSRGLAVRARVNDNGDGLIIEEDPTALGGETPFVPIQIASTGGTTAKDLNIIGESADIAGGFVDGSYERVVDLVASDTLETVVEKINDAGIPVDAALVNSGGGATPFRLNLTSAITGRAGRLVIDTGGVDLGLNVLSEGRDAKVLFGSDDPDTGFLITSSTNTLSDVVPGVTIDLLEASDDPVTLTVGRDETAIVDAVGQMVAAFNDAVGRLGQYDFYDIDSEERGPLLGDPTVARIRSALYSTATRPALGVEGSYRYLSQVGIRFDSDGQMTFDQSKFLEAYAADPAGVEELFAAYEVTAGQTQEIAEGVTVDSTETTFSALGFGNLFDRLLDDLTNSVDGTTTIADQGFQSRIDLLNDRIETMDQRLAARREQLTNQFVAMETALARLQSQSSSLLSLSSNVSLSRSSLSG